MSALAWDGLAISTVFAVILLAAAAVKLTLAAIGDLDHEAHPVLVTMSWLHRLLERIWPVRGRHASDDERDTDTLRIYSEAAAERLVQPHDPPGPGDQASLPDADNPTGTGPGDTTTLALDAVDVLIEQMRQRTVVDPQFPAWVADALGCTSVASYLEKMAYNLRAVADA